MGFIVNKPKYFIEILIKNRNGVFELKGMLKLLYWLSLKYRDI